MKADDNWFHIEGLSEGLYGIGEPGHIEEVNSFLLVGSNESLLIDTGMGFCSMKSAIEKITDFPCRVLNTHSHFDHVGSNSEFVEVAMFDHPANRRAALSGFAPEFLSRWATQDQFVEDPPIGITIPYSISPFPHASFFQDGESIGNSSFDLKALHTPGHCDDSVCFWEPARGWIFSGDLLYDGPIYIEKQGGLGKFKESVSRVSSLNGLSKIYSSHNYFEFPLEKFEKLQETLADISSRELEQEVVIEGRLRLVPE